MKIRPILLLLAVGTLHGQEVRRAEPAAPAAPATPAASVVSQDALAKYLAGIALPPSSPLAALQEGRQYAEHVAALARLSQHYDRNYFSKMRAWSAAELAPRLAMNRPVYYFFGGPDAVSALALFPDAPVYILGGLESVGSIPDPLTLPHKAVGEGLANLRKSTEVILSYGHFITKDMKAELDRTAFRGVLPVIYTFIALSGGEVISATLVDLSRDGTLVAAGNPQGAQHGVRIDFRRGPGAAPQILFYVQADVSNDGLKSNGALLKWTSGFGAGNVYLKAASYLMHETYFSGIRDFLLRNASVLQDDSGIPFKFFRNEKWRCYFFGTYSGTLEIFRKYHQPDLQVAFQAAGTAVPLPFGTGYKWRMGESNLMLAVRQEAPRAAPAINHITP